MRIISLGLVLLLALGCSGGGGEASDDATLGAGNSGDCSTRDSESPVTFTVEATDGSVLGSYSGERFIVGDNAIGLRAICGDQPRSGTTALFSLNVRDEPGVDTTAFVAGVSYDASTPDLRNEGSLKVTDANATFSTLTQPPQGVVVSTLEEAGEYQKNWIGFYSTALDYPLRVPESEEERSKPGFTEDFDLTPSEVTRLDDDDPSRREPSRTHRMRGTAHMLLAPVLLLSDGERLDPEREPLVLRIEF